MQSEFNGRMLEIFREMAGAAFITLPSSDADFANPEIAADLERYMRSGTVRRENPRKTDAAHLGFPRLRIRQPPRAI